MKEKELLNKINAIGGVGFNPTCKGTNNEAFAKANFSSLEKIFNAELPSSYKEFYRLFGPCAFKEMVSIKGIDTIPIASEENSIHVNYFYSVEDSSDCSVLKVIQRYEEQLHKGYFPICDGEPGDLICICLNKENWGRIYYWHHESPEGKDIYLLTRNFENFLLSLSLEKDDSQSLDKIVDEMKVEVSPAMLELLKKSGYGPKK